MEEKQFQFFYNLAKQKTAAKEYEAAIAGYDQALRLQPNHASAYYKRGKLI